MNLILIAALVAVCGAAKLDRTYLPPVSAKTAGGSPGSLQVPFSGNSFNEPSSLPKGSFTNDFQGVVVDAANAGTRASGEGETGLGGPRVSYGSTDSRVGEAAFRDAPNFRPFPGSNEQSQDGQAASSQVAPDFNLNRFAPESRPERPQAAFDRTANTVRFENEVGTDSYHYAYETDNGISAEENGVATNGVQAQGGFSYTGDDGQVYTVTYVADEGGYQPRGDHLPTPPPIPEEILKALEKNAKDEAAGVVDDGSYDAQRYNAGTDYSDSGNAEFIDSQTSKFGKQPESDATASGSFIDQSNQDFRPNGNAPGQESFDNSQDSNNFGSASVGNFEQAGQPSRGPSANTFGRRPSSGFDSRKEYLPPTTSFNQNRRPQRPFASSGSNAPQFNNFNGNSQAFNSNGQPQNIQGPSSLNVARPGSNRLDVLAQSASKDNSLDNNEFAPSNNNAQAGQISPIAGSRHEYLPPVDGFGQNGRTQNLRPQRPTASAETTTTPSFNSFSSNTGSFQDNNDANEPSAAQFNGFQQRPQAFNNRFSQNRVQSSQGGQKQNQPGQGQSVSSFESINSQQPTSQPSSELTTPFESNEQSQDSTSGTPAPFHAFNPQQNSRPSQFANRPIGQFSGPSRPQNQPTSTKTQDFSSSQGQNLFNRPSFSSNQQPEKPLSENDRDVNDAQFAPSTVRPTFGQAQGPDDSYYYRQPSKPFNTPSTSRFPAAPSSQFNRVSQQSSVGSGQFAQEPHNNFQPQNNFNRGTIKYPEPPTLAPVAPTVPFDQFQGTTTAAQFTDAAISPFQPLNGGTTKYPRPPTLTPTAPTTQFNSITQATASSFTSAPSSSFGSQASFQKPSQFNFQSQTQGSSQFSQDSNQPSQKEPQVATQQYDGEIYEYSKPSQGLPAPAQKETGSRVQNIPESQPTRSQYDATQGSSNVQAYTQQPTGPTFGGRPQFESQRPQFSNQFSQEQSQDSTPQFNAQSFDKSPEQGRPAQGNRSKCCQSLDSRLHSFQGVQGSGPVPTQSQFGAQFSAPTSQTVSQNSGFGETFGGPREPPSFNQETGYHY